MINSHKKRKAELMEELKQRKEAIKRLSVTSKLLLKDKMPRQKRGER